VSHKPARALVTGGSSGIGAALARRLAARGLEVWLAARTQDALDREVAAITAAGGRAHALALDVADGDATVERLARLDEESGGIDLVVANAGFGRPMRLAEGSWRDVRAQLDVNLLGAAATLMAFIPRMVARGHGHLVGISSIAAELPNPRAAAYGASKSALTYFLEAADLELRPLGVAVTVVHPGFVRTPAHDKTSEPLPFIVSADEAARRIDRGIERRAHLVRFPFILSFLSRFGRALPWALAAPLIRRATAKR
jgi:short-subunit dehydrogenase